MCVSGFKEDLGVHRARAIGGVVFVDLSIKEFNDLMTNGYSKFNTRDYGVEKFLKCQ